MMLKVKTIQKWKPYLDPNMLIILIMLNMEIEITEEEAGHLQEKQLIELLLDQ